MSIRSQLTKDLNDSVQALLGKHVKILLKKVVKLEIKSDKTENRVLVFSPCRLFFLTAKVPPRIDMHCHYLEIQAIESKVLNQLSLTINERMYTFFTTDGVGSEEVDAMVQALYSAMHNIFPFVPLTYIIRRIEVLPESRVQYLDDRDYYNDSRGIGPCGGFSTQYACMCDYHSLPYREEVAWDVDTIYLSHDTRQLCLRDFEHLDLKDLVPIISALEYNTWFTKLKASNVKLTHEAIERILHIMKKSISIEEIYLDNLNVKWDFAHKLSLSLIANGNTVLHTLDLSNNLIEDKGASSLCGFVAKVTQGTPHMKSPISRAPKGLVHLNLSNCGLTSKGVNHIAHALSLNKCTPETLSYLNLSGNNLKEDVTNLCNFLAQPNVISHLDISKTDCPLENIFGALLRGCASNLIDLNVSHNVFNIKKSKELPPSFKQFFTSCLSLKNINMSSCKLPLDAAKNLLLGLACNETIEDVSLDISCNNFGSQGAHVLESCIHGVISICTLDISENCMDVELASVITAIGKNKSIKHLYMGRNIINMKSKHVTTVMDALVQMIQEEDCVLQTLSIPDCKLKSDLYNLINALGGNQCLQTLDISGNLMGDPGARLLGKALQINSHLRSITYDHNNFTLQGYTDLAYALESNYTIRYMPVPISDIIPCTKISAERTESIMKKIQNILHRNVSPKRYSNGHAFRLQQGFLLSSTQQMVDRLITQTQDIINNSTSGEAGKNINECDIDYAKKIVHDAENSKHLLSYLHNIVEKGEQIENPIEQMLRYISNELCSTVITYLQDTMKNIVNAAEEECPTIFANEKFQDDIRSVARMKIYLDPEFIHSCIVDQAGTQIMNKINDLNLAVAAHVSDKITDEVIESLSKCHKTLTGDKKHKRSLTPDVLKSMSRVSSISSRDSSENNYTSHHRGGDRSPIATPHLTSKRKSLHGRKLRPKSVVDCVEGMSADDIPDLLPSLESSADESLDSVSELPQSVNQQLQHLAKGRPKRAKTRATSRSHIRGQEDAVDDNSCSAALDSFFKFGGSGASSLTPLASPSTEDSSISSLLTDVSPNQMSPNADIKLDYEKKDNNSLSVSRHDHHNSLPKKSHLVHLETPSSAPRSISSDNLTKFSPTNISPLARRIANFEQPSTHEDIKSNNLCNNKISKHFERKLIKSDSSTESTISGGGGNSASCNVDLLQNINSCKRISVHNDSSSSQLKSPSPLTTLKPRRWSMVDNANEQGNEVHSLSSERMPSSSTISTINEPLQEPESPLEKKSVRELAASLIKQSKDSPDNQRKLESGFNLMKPPRIVSSSVPIPFTQRRSSEDFDKNNFPRPNH